MALHSKPKFDLNHICKDYGIEWAEIANAPITNFQEVLKSIFDDYILTTPELETLKVEILNILNKSLKGRFHSIRARVKDPEHLIEKIIRNVNGRPDKYSGISEDNYNKLITDLIGIRIIILNKHDWKEIHKSLLFIFNNQPDRYAEKPTDIEKNYDLYPYDESKGESKLTKSYHAEKPVVYITSEDDRNLYKDEYLTVDTAKLHYRSIHYIIRYGKIYFEIQVRTLFEEGWLEFDHRVKYPYDQNNTKKQEYVEILSSLAVAADRLISFYSEDDFKEKGKKKAIKETQPNDAASSPSPVEAFQDKMILKY